LNKSKISEKKITTKSCYKKKTYVKLSGCLNFSIERHNNAHKL
jgi:hypothetical protein